jgi:hypothetical protein
MSKLMVPAVSVQYLCKVTRSPLAAARFTSFSDNTYTGPVEPIWVLMDVTMDLRPSNTGDVRVVVSKKRSEAQHDSAEYKLVKVFHAVLRCFI